MFVSYKSLWKLLIERDMLKKDLRKTCGLSTVTMAKLAKNKSVNLSVLLRICTALNCGLPDVAEFVGR